jgi:hypothetical protein
MKRITQINENKLSRIIKKIILEEKSKKSMDDIPDRFFRNFLSKTSDIMTTEEFSDIEEILGKRVSANGSGIGEVFEKIFQEARRRR